MTMGSATFNIGVNINANDKASAAFIKFIGTLKLADATLEKTSKASKKLAGTQVNTAKKATAFTAVVNKQVKILQALYGPTKKVTAAISHTAAGFAKASYRVSDATANMAHNSIRSMLSLQSMFKKILHYITFSIGVQMVMKVSQGFRDLIENFQQFERAATNAATISGYLGASFEQVRNRIMGVSKELASRTVYSAIEVADAFYDLASAGVDVAKVTEEDLLPILDYAAATQGDLKEATKAVMVTLKQFQMDMSETGHIVDVFTTAITTSFMTMEKMREAMKYTGTIAGILGVSVEETAAGVTLLVNRGMEGCYDEKTRVLTNDGFKYFKDLEGDEEFLTYNIETELMEWQTSSKYFEYEVDKPLYKIKNRYLDLFVTDNHNMLVSGRFDKKFRIEKAKDVYGKSRRYKLSGDWIGKQPKYIKIGDKKISFNLWTKFLAMYLSEGHINKNPKNGDYKIIISQRENGKCYNEIESCLEELPYNYDYTQSTGQFRMHCKDLHSYLRQFGRSNTKHIPENIKSAKKETLEEFYRIYNLCDGDNNGDIYTSSLKMRDDIIEILMKIGIAPSYKLKTKKGTRRFIRDHWVTAMYDNWIINVNRKHIMPLFSRDNYTKWHERRFRNSWGKSIKEEWKHYKGKVYCVTVPNHTLVVERNGKIAICGNSQAGQRLNMVFNKLLKPTEKAKESLMQMGLTMKDLNPETHTLVEVLYKLQAAGFGASEAAIMFRARTAGAAAALVENADEVARMVTQYEMAAGITRAVAAAQEETLWGALKKTKDEFMNMGLAAGNELRPAIMGVVTILRDLLMPVLGALGNAVKSIGGFVSNFSTAFIALTSMLITYYIVMKAATAGTYLHAIALKAVAFAKIVAGVATHFVTAATTLYSAGTAVATGISAKFALALHSVGTAMWLSLGPIGLMVLAVGALVAIYAMLVTNTRNLSNEQQALYATLSEGEKIIYNLHDQYDTMEERIDAFLMKLWVGGEAVEEYKDKLIEMLELKDAKGLADLYTETEEGAERVREAIEEIYGAEFTQIIAKDILAEPFIDYEIALRDVKIAQDEATDALEKHGDASVAFIAASKNLTAAELKYNQALGSILTTLRKLPGNLELYIGKIEDASAASSKFDSVGRRLARLNISYANAIDAVAQALTQYGASSREVADAEVNLTDIISERIDLEQELADIEIEREDALTVISDALSDRFISTEELVEATGKQIMMERDLNETQKEFLGMAQVIIDARDSLIKAKEEEAILDAKIAVQEQIRADATRYLEEKARSLWETENKLYDIRYKLYKLAQDEDEQLEDIFDKMAEQGLLTDDMITMYKDLQIAQGGVAKQQFGFAQAYGDLSTEQKNLVDSFMSGEASMQDLQNAGIENVDVFMNYKDAMDNLSSATDEFGDLMGPLVQHMIDIGAVSSDVAKSFYDWIDNIFDVADANLKLDQTSQMLLDDLQAVMNSVAAIGYALADGEQGTKNFADSFDELLGELGVEVPSMADMSALFGFDVSSFSQLSDEQLVLAATMLKLANDANIWESGMSMADIATKLNISSTDDLNDNLFMLGQMAITSTTGLTTYADNMEDVGNATDTTTLAIDTLRVSLDLLFQKMGEDPSDGLFSGLSVDDIVDLEYNKVIEQSTQQALTAMKKAGVSDEDMPTPQWQWEGGRWQYGDESMSPGGSDVGGEVQNEGSGFWDTLQRGWDRIFGGMTRTPEGQSWDYGDESNIPSANDIGEAVADAISGGNPDIKEMIIGIPGVNSAGMFGGGPGVLDSDIGNIAEDAKYSLSEGGDDAGDSLKQGAQIVSTTGLNAAQLASNLATNAASMASSRTISASSIFNSGVIGAGKIFGSNLLSILSGLKGFVEPEPIVEPIPTIQPRPSTQPRTPTPTTYGTRPSTTSSTTSTTQAVDDLGSTIQETGSLLDGVVDTLGGIYEGVTDFFGGLFGFERGGIINRPTPGVFGEKGAEALIPLEGANRKYGEELFRELLPIFGKDIFKGEGIGGGVGGGRRNKYMKDIQSSLIDIMPDSDQRYFGSDIMNASVPDHYKDLGRDSGIGGNKPERTVSHNTTRGDDFNIMGPLNINGVTNTQDFETKFMEMMKRRRRISMSN